MVNIEHYIINLTELLRQKFGTQLLYIGLQGSYLRNEATENSDIDVVVILDALTINDINTYNDNIKKYNEYQKSINSDKIVKKYKTDYKYIDYINFT